MIQTLDCEINRVEYTVNLVYLRKMLSSTIQEGKRLRKELNQIALQYGVEVDFSSSKEVAQFVNKFLLRDKATVNKITSESLDYLFVKSQDDFYIKLKNYKRCRDRYRKITAFINSLSITFDDLGNNCVYAFMESDIKTAIIKPVFTVNKSGNISMTQPAMPFLVTEVMKLLRFNVAIRFESNDEVVGFLGKYGDIIWGDAMGKGLLVAGKVLYAQMILNEYYIIPLSDGEDEMKRLIEQFNLEYRNPLEISSKIIFED